MMTLDIQRRLKALGYDPGPLDGVRGRITIATIRRFQADHGLEADGLAGPDTLARLFDGGAPRAEKREEGLQLRPWFAEALRLKGIREETGAADNPTIVGWARALQLPFAHDATAWCGLFVAHCVAAALPDEPLPSNPLGARTWLRFGTHTEPGLGAILVFWRGERAGWKGHVGFYAGEDAAAFHVLGGNQADAVSITRLAKTRLLGARWPITVPKLSPTQVARAGGGGLSADEA